VPEWNKEEAAHLYAAWPEGVPAEEAALLRSLPRARYDLVMSRLAAVLGAERGGDLSVLADALGLDRIAFFRLRKRWAGDRSIRSLTPFATRAVRTIGSGHLQPLVRLALDIVRENPEIELSEVVDRLRSAHGAGLSNQTALRIARDARTALATDPEYLSHHVGKRLLADLCGTTIEYRRRDGSTGTISVCVVVEAASRLVLGAAAGDAWNGLELQREAAAAAHDSVSGVDSSSARPAEIVLVLAPGLEAFFPKTPVGMSLISRGERRFGQRLVTLVGHRLGRLQLRPRKTLWERSGARGDAIPVVDLADGAALAMSSIREYNRERIAALGGGIPRLSGANDPVGLIRLIEPEGTRLPAIASCLGAVVDWNMALAQQQAKLRALKRRTVNSS